MMKQLNLKSQELEKLRLALEEASKAVEKVQIIEIEWNQVREKEKERFWEIEEAESVRRKHGGGLLSENWTYFMEINSYSDELSRLQPVFEAAKKEAIEKMEYVQQLQEQYGLKELEETKPEPEQKKPREEAVKAEEKFKNEEKEFNPYLHSCPDPSCYCHGCNDDSCSMCVSIEEKKDCGYYRCPLA